MKKLLISATALALTAGGALAADLPSRKAEPLLPPPPPPMWTGFYAGLNAGYNFGTNGDAASRNFANPVPAGPLGIIVDPTPASMSGSQSLSQNGFLGGLQIGYNFQWGNFLLGVETDIQGAGVRGSSVIRSTAASQVQIPLVVTIDQTSNGSTEINAGLDYLGTARGRLGYLVTPTLLLYGTGGFAYGGAYSQVRQTAYEYVAITQPLFPPQYAMSTWLGGGQQSQLLIGWTAGGGLEWMVMPNWSLKAEALYWDLGRMSVKTTPALSPALNGLGVTSVSYSGVAARAGVNYHFNWGSFAPTLAAW